MDKDLERFWAKKIRLRFIRDARASGREDLVPKVLEASAKFLWKHVTGDVKWIEWPEVKTKTKRAGETAPAVPKDPPPREGKAARKSG